jgi:hypothetical protein
MTERLAALIQRHRARIEKRALTLPPPNLLDWFLSEFWEHLDTADLAHVRAALGPFSASYQVVQRRAAATATAAVDPADEVGDDEGDGVA